MKLRRSQTKITFFNKNRRHQTGFFKEHIALRYRDNDLLQPAIQQIRNQNYQKANLLLGKLAQQYPNNLDVLRLRGEFFFTYFSYLSAWEQYDIILKLKPHDQEALVISSACAYILRKEKEFISRLTILKYRYPHLADKLMYYLKLNQTYFRKLDFPTQIPKESKIDLIILFGKQINHDGSLSNELLDRMKTALSAAVSYKQAKIITLGGAIHNQYYEGEVLHNWLTDHHIQPQRIILDLSGLDLVSETFAVLDVIRQNNYKNILILSSKNDLPRHYLSLEAAINSENLYNITLYPVNNPQNNLLEISAKEQTKSWQSTLRSAGVFSSKFYNK